MSALVCAQDLPRRRRPPSATLLCAGARMTLAGCAWLSEVATVHGKPVRVHQGLLRDLLSKVLLSQRSPRCLATGVTALSLLPAGAIASQMIGRNRLAGGTTRPRHDSGHACSHSRTASQGACPQ